MLAKAGVPAHASWAGSDRLEQHFLNIEGGRIAVLVLPPLPANAQAVPKSYIHQLENAVHGLRGSVKLIIAMSSWGYMREQEIFASQGPYPDLLLGSGPGAGQVGQMAANGKSVWIRSFSQGKSFLRIDVLAWPEHNANFKWTEEKNIRMGIYGLTDQYQESPQLLNLMHSMGTD